MPSDTGAFFLQPLAVVLSQQPDSWNKQNQGSDERNNPPRLTCLEFYKLNLR